MILPRDFSPLVSRQTQDCDNGIYGNGNCYYYSAWDSWVRWLVFGLIILAFFFIFVLCSCLTARRRRRAGLTPYYGTG